MPQLPSEEDREAHQRWLDNAKKAKQDLNRLQRVIDALCVATELLRQEREPHANVTRLTPWFMSGASR